VRARNRDAWRPLSVPQRWEKRLKDGWALNSVHWRPQARPGLNTASIQQRLPIPSKAVNLISRDEDQSLSRVEFVGAALEGADAGTRQTVQKRVLQRLRIAILNGDLGAGTRLVQSELAQVFNVSTTPIREALRHLEAEGLVEIDAYRGAVVRVLSSRELEELFSLRAIIEPESLRRAVPISSAVLDAATEIHQRMMAAKTSGEFAMLNQEFHLTLHRASGSRFLVQMVSLLMDPAVAYVGASLRAQPELLLRSIDEHSRLLDALRRDDVEAAVSIQLKHLEIPHEALDLD